MWLVCSLNHSRVVDEEAHLGLKADTETFHVRTAVELVHRDWGLCSLNHIFSSSRVLYYNNLRFTN